MADHGKPEGWFVPIRRTNGMVIDIMHVPAQALLTNVFLNGGAAGYFLLKGGKLTLLALLFVVTFALTHWVFKLLTARDPYWFDIFMSELWFRLDRLFRTRRRRSTLLDV